MSKLASQCRVTNPTGFVAEDGERLTLVEFEDDVTQFDWASHQSIVLPKSVGDLLFTVNTRYKFAK